MNNSGPSAIDLIEAVARTAGALEAEVARAVEARSGLTLAQLAFLRCVAGSAGEGVALGGVAERLCCARSNATQLADRLEAQTLIRRQPDPEDGRRVRAVLTPAGRRRLEAGEEARRACAERLLSDVAASERRALAVRMEHLQEATRVRSATPW